MAYNTKRNFVPVSAVVFVNQAASASTLTGVFVGGSTALLGGSPLTQGVLVGIRATLRDNDANSADTITIKVWKTSVSNLATTGEELYSGSFGFASDQATLSAQLAGQGVPFFEQPFVEITPGVADTDLEVTLYVASLP